MVRRLISVQPNHRFGCKDDVQWSVCVYFFEASHWPSGHTILWKFKIRLDNGTNLFLVAYCTVSFQQYNLLRNSMCIFLPWDPNFKSFTSVFLNNFFFILFLKAFKNINSNFSLKSTPGYYFLESLNWDTKKVIWKIGMEHWKLVWQTPCLGEIKIDWHKSGLWSKHYCKRTTKLPY